MSLFEIMVGNQDRAVQGHMMYQYTGGRRRRRRTGGGSPGRNHRARRRLPDAGRLRAVLRPDAALGPHLRHDRPPGPDRRPALHGAGELRRQPGGRRQSSTPSCSSGCVHAHQARGHGEIAGRRAHLRRDQHHGRRLRTTRTSRRASFFRDRPPGDRAAEVPRRAVPHGETPWRAGRAPLLGEHTSEVLRSASVTPHEDIARLREQGAI